jgi:hypothetical protein
MPHVGGHLRDAFVWWVENDLPDELPADTYAYDFRDGQPRSARWLIGRLWNCSDVMPKGLREEVADVLGIDERDMANSYGAAVQRIRAWQPVG